MTNSTGRFVAPMIAAIWIGLIIGVAFYASSIKFTAPGVGRTELLSVGQVTFQGLTWVEFAAFVSLLLASWRLLTGSVVKGIVVLALLLVIQKLAVQPILNTEITRAIAGESVETLALHLVYGGLDCAKLAVLFLLTRTFSSVAD